MAIITKRTIGKLLLWIVISAFGGGVLFVGCALLLFHLLFSGNCDVTIIQNSRSPDGTMELVVALSECGTFSSDVHRIYLVPIGKQFKPENQVFGCPEVRKYSAQWLKPDQVRILFSSKNNPNLRIGKSTTASSFIREVRDIPHPLRWLHPQTGRNMTVEVVRSCPKQ